MYNINILIARVLVGIVVVFKVVPAAMSDGHVEWQCRMGNLGMTGTLATGVGRTSRI